MKVTRSLLGRVLFAPAMSPQSAVWLFLGLVLITGACGAVLVALGFYPVAIGCFFVTYLLERALTDQMHRVDRHLWSEEIERRNEVEKALLQRIKKGGGRSDE